MIGRPKIRMFEEAFELLGAVAFVLLIVELRRTGPER